MKNLLKCLKQTPHHGLLFRASKSNHPNAGLTTYADSDVVGDGMEREPTFFCESKQLIYSVRNVQSRETEQHYLNIVM